jgi:hypothetical protein
MMAALGLGLAVSQPASAVIVSSTLNTDFSGATDATGFPTISFNDFDGSGTVHVILNNTGLAPADTAFTSDWWFNFSGDATQLTLGNFTTSGGDGVTLPPGVATCNNCTGGGNSEFRPDGDGFFDVWLEFATAAGGRFDAGEIVEFDITLAGITADNFNLQSIDGPGDTTNDHWCAATHGQGLTNGASDFLGGQCDRFPPAGNGAPEPGTLLLLGATALGAGLVGRRRMRRG